MEIEVSPGRHSLMHGTHLIIGVIWEVLAIIVSCKDDSSRRTGVLRSNDVSEGPFTKRGRIRESILFDMPIKRFQGLDDMLTD